MGVQTFLLKGANRFINKADSQAAADAVDSLRKAKPDATAEELADQLIRRKCRQAGSVGAITSGAAIVPGLGTVAAMTFGVAADIGMTFKLQAELVLEIAHAYGRELSENEKQKVILTITGISAGSQAAVQKAGQQIATKATAQLAQKSIAKAIPFLGVAASGGTNIVSTYIIGRRAQAYFSVGPDEMDDWKDGLRAISGVDEQEIIQWLGESTESTWQMVSSGTQSATESVIVTGKNSGTAVVLYSQKAAQSLAESGGWLAQKVKDGVTSVWPFNRQSDEEPEVDLENIEMGDQTVIGVVGAGDEIDGQAADEGYLQKISQIFAWRTDDPEAETIPDDDLLNELYQPNLPKTMVVVDDEPDENEGMISKVISIFKRD